MQHRLMGEGRGGRCYVCKGKKGCAAMFSHISRVDSRLQLCFGTCANQSVVVDIVQFEDVDCAGHTCEAL
jgi:hypothetical protein